MESIERNSQERSRAGIEAADKIGGDHRTACAPGTISSLLGRPSVAARLQQAEGEATDITAGPTGAVRGLQTAAPTDGAPTALGTSLATPGAAALARTMDLSDVRLEEVVRLRLAIASGRYRISAADLADKMIASFRGGSVLRQFS